MRSVDCLPIDPPAAGLRRFNLLPGEYLVRTAPCLIATIVGSCVAVTLFNRVLRIGGMNHYLLPDTPPQAPPPPEPGRYGDVAIPALLKVLLRHDPDPAHLEAMIFGGGRVMEAITGFQIGEKNAAIARRLLAEKNVRVTHEELLPPHGLKIIFAPHCGRVSVEAVERAV